MATISITSLGLGNADLTAIGKLSGTGLSQIEVAAAVVEGDKLKKGNKIVAYDGHLTSTSNPHSTTANQVGAYSKIEVDNLLTNTETLLSNKVDKVTGKGLSTNDFTDTFKQALESNKVQNITTNSVTKKLVVTYTDATVANLNINDIITDVKVSGATLDATTNVLTLTSTDGGADVTVDLSDFVNSGELTSALSGKADTIHSHTTSDITGLDDTLSNLVSDLSNKQEILVSGTSIKTINGESVLGSGNIVITGGGSGGEVDLTNYYTKSETYSKVETNSLVATKQDTLVSGTSIKTINGQSVLGSGDIVITGGGSGGEVTLGEYGVRWNQETDVYEALGSVNRGQIQGNMKRCVLKDDGTVNYYLHPTNSTLKANSTPANLTGADGNVMVEVPKFWYKHTLVGDTHEWWVSNTPLEGYSVHPWFLEGGVERPFRYYRAYTCTNVGGKLRSISGSTPTSNQTRATFRTQARANGTGWGLCSWNAVNAIQILFLTEYCTFNTQAVLGSGNDIGGDSGITTGQSNSIGNGSSGLSNNNMWMSYRGIENWYADCWEFIDGINNKNYKVFLNQNPATFADDVFTGDYVDSGITLPAMAGDYIKKISGNFIPTAVGASSATFVTDAGWSVTGNTVMGFGGSANNGFMCGGFTFDAYISSGYLGTGSSAGLSR
jgi:hypothetical protein